MLNHLRFYLPEVYPKLHKILFLDDDIVVQKDLTPLWDVDLKGMVNGAVDTRKGNFHRFDKYLNFSNPKISENFDSDACGWAFAVIHYIGNYKPWLDLAVAKYKSYWSKYVGKIAEIITDLMMPSAPRVFKLNMKTPNCMVSSDK
ncbi:hypothetical protein F3Y22_tig00111493pilonHSYRG00054 [Hibiscus syriacus]|uniref:Hexosyltransferase n=1 Tax=Hibiscus syriacus TaxID=106335 RepID=A0A6A2YI76_HIBSY|nr:hypothetical protein F3Y22_tig00111493pilonHSYRG00054 [Hibiscus syriacus]